MSAVETRSASAATPACGQHCISVSAAQPNFVEDILGAAAQVGQPVGLKQASGSDSSEDILPRRGKVSDFYAAGMASADVNDHYGSLQVVQQE